MKKKGTLITQKRVEKGITQGELARLSGFSRYHINSYESGRLLPTILVLKQLAPALGCDYKELIDPSLYEDLEGSPLTRMRKRYGLTQKELAAKIGRSQKLISAWERESRLANKEMLDRMAKELECEIEDLI